MYPGGKLSEGEKYSEEDMDEDEFSSEGEKSSEEDMDEDEKSLDECDLTMACSSTDSKRVSKVQNEMDGRLWGTLPAHLLEEMVARLPFKSLFQTSSLSKTWALKFLSPSFQSHVHSSTPTWKSYCPLFSNDKKELLGYENGSQRWHRLPTHFYLPESVVQGWFLRAAGGSVLCWTARDGQTYQVWVSNPLTRSCKQLPNRPNMSFPDGVHVHCEGINAYQVVLVTLQYPYLIVQIFDSTSGSWIVPPYKNVGNLKWIGSAYIDGVVYLVGTKVAYRIRSVQVPRCSLISFNSETKFWEEIPSIHFLKDEDLSANQDEKHYQQLELHSVRFSEVIVCGSDVMLVVQHKGKMSRADTDMEDGRSDDETIDVSKTLSVFKLVLDWGLAFEVPRAPRNMLVEADVSCAAGQGDYIHVGGQFLSRQSMLQYDVISQNWELVPSARDQIESFGDFFMSPQRWTSTTYQPGLNPFLNV